MSPVLIAVFSHHAQRRINVKSRCLTHFLLHASLMFFKKAFTRAEANENIFASLEIENVCVLTNIQIWPSFASMLFPKKSFCINIFEQKYIESLFY